MKSVLFAPYFGIPRVAWFQKTLKSHSYLHTVLSMLNQDGPHRLVKSKETKGAAIGLPDVQCRCLKEEARMLSLLLKIVLVLFRSGVLNLGNFLRLVQPAFVLLSFLLPAGFIDMSGASFPELIDLVKTAHVPSSPPFTLSDVLEPSGTLSTYSETHSSFGR